MEQVIGLLGAKGAGKTTAFEAMSERVIITEVTLAAKLKDVCSEVFEIPRDHFDRHDTKELPMDPPIFLTSDLIIECYNKFGINDDRVSELARFHIGNILFTPREVAQYIGTEVLRSVDNSIHCHNAVKGKAGKILVVTDIRFPDELEYFSTNYSRFTSVYIKNTGAEIESGRDNHASESHLEHLASVADHIISNDGPLQDFQVKIRNFMEGIKDV